MAEHNLTGTYGENIAVKYLLDKGYVILDRNWHCGHKELDIVAVSGNLLVIVEVKTRYSDEYGNPEDAVTDTKIRRVVSATDAYIRFFAIDMQVRFDVITVIIGNGSPVIQHIEDAFFPPIW